MHKANFSTYKKARLSTCIIASGSPSISTGAAYVVCKLFSQLRTAVAHSLIKSRKHPPLLDPRRVVRNLSAARSGASHVTPRPVRRSRTKIVKNR